MQISGLATGLDVEAIITQLMAIERRPLVAMEQRKNKYQEEKNAWRDINTRLLNLQNNLDSLLAPDLFQRMAATSSKADVVTASASSKALDGKYDIEVEQLAQAHRVASKRFDEVDSPLGLEGTFKINEMDITIEADDSLIAIRDKLREAGILANIVDNTLILTAKETGLAGAFTFKDDDGVLADLELVEGENFKTVLQEPLDAIFTIDGLKVTRSSNTIDDVVEGVTFQLRDVGQGVIEVKKDNDRVIQAVKSMVQQFNSTYGFINEKMGEGALLQGDQMMLRLQNSLRRVFMDPVAGSSLGSVGISISKEGIMSLDEAKLKKALEEDPAGVYELLGSKDGAIARAQEFIKTYTKTDGLLAEKQKVYDGRLRDLERRMEDFERRMELRQANLERQWSQLETALSYSLSQQDWLTSQLTALQYFYTPRRT
ncbi:MAG: flagellar filament capping protein FliD [Firmicutes bacterium]|nr:flagellar filament capping protein FliD [Bacillota bacterium]